MRLDVGTSDLYLSNSIGVGCVEPLLHLVPMLAGARSKDLELYQFKIPQLAVISVSVTERVTDVWS